MDEVLLCPGCKNPVGDPLDPKAPLNKKVQITERYIMICAKCFEFMRGTKDGKLEILSAKDRAALILFKPEIIRYLAAVWAAQPAMKASEN